MLLWYCTQKQYDPTADKNLQELHFVFQNAFRDRSQAEKLDAVHNSNEEYIAKSSV